MNDSLDQLIVDAVREALDPFSDTTIADAIRRIPAASLAQYLHARFDEDDSAPSC